MLFTKMLLHLVVDEPVLQEIADAISQTLYKARKIAQINRDDFKKHVVCPGCDETYKYEDCLQTKNGKNFNNLMT